MPNKRKLGRAVHLGHPNSPGVNQEDGLDVGGPYERFVELHISQNVRLARRRLAYCRRLTRISLKALSGTPALLR